MFMDSMCLKVDKNTVLTACLIYSLKKKNVKQDISGLKEEKNANYEYNRINEDKDYIREAEGDVLELIENFGGMLMHRESRLAFSPKEAIELLETKNLKGKKNRFLEDFKFFIDVMENASDIRNNN